MNINKHYKVLVDEDLNLNPTYDYFTCVGELEDYFLLHSFDYWLKSNGFEAEIAFSMDLEETKENFPIIFPKQFKQINSVESIYYKDKSIDISPLKVYNKRKFILV